MATVTLAFTFTGDHGTVCNDEVDYDLTLDPAGSADEYIEEKCKELSEESEEEDEDGETIREEFEGEYTVVGYSDFSEDFELSDFSDLAAAVEFAELLENADNAEAVELYAKEHGIEYASGADEAFQGVYNDEEDFAESIAEDLYDIPEHLRFYIDYAKMGADLMHDYTGIESGGKLYVFRNF